MGCPTNTIDQNVTDLVSRVVDLTNEQRVRHGLRQLSIDERLIAVAQDHSDFMASTSNLTHDQNGLSLGQRFHRSGYPYSRIAENVAKGQRSPEDVVSSWMNSAGHRHNILNQGYQHIGIGRTGDYWTMDLGGSHNP